MSRAEISGGAIGATSGTLPVCSIYPNTAFISFALAICFNTMDGPRIDLKMAELRKEWEAAKKLPAVTGYDEEIKNYQSFLSTVESFMKDMQKARDKGKYSAEDYDAMSNAYEYGLSVI